jgi:hypothetical protein
MDNVQNCDSYINIILIISYINIIIYHRHKHIDLERYKYVFNKYQHNKISLTRE